MNLNLPESGLVILIGPSGSGKTTLARKLFHETEIISSDQCRALVADDPSSQSASRDAFDVLQLIAAKRLKRNLLTVADATSVQEKDRAALQQLAREQDSLCSAIVMNMSEDVCQERNRQREDRRTPPHAIAAQSRHLRRTLRNIRKERFHRVHYINGPEQAGDVTVTRVSLWSNKKDLTGPFDIIGDVHGCAGELHELLGKLGYRAEEIPDSESGVPARKTFRHPEGRTAVFLGDLADRGPNVPEVFRTVMDMTQAQTALCVPGNHDDQLVRKIKGRKVDMAHGLAESMAELEQEPPEFAQQIRAFIDGLPSYYLLDGGKLAVAHAGLLEEYQGKASPRVRDFCLYGDTLGESKGQGRQARNNWAQDYRGAALVVHGHLAASREPQRTNNVINIDTGCVYGGQLTALRYPEMELVQVAAHAVHFQYETPPGEQPKGPMENGASAILRAEDATGQQEVWTRLNGKVRPRPENAAAALETFGRFTLNPKWLVYIPPTMAPTRAADLPGTLERPEEALKYYRNAGVDTVVCEEKHMGSRAVLILGQDRNALEKRFGATLPGAAPGVCYTRTGRRFFDDPELENEILSRAAAAAGQAGLWERLESPWAILDCEIMPWSLKAESLIRREFDPVGVAALAALGETERLLETARARGVDTAAENGVTAQRAQAARRYTAAYNRYRTAVNGPEDIQIAPFHLMAAEGRPLTGMNHLWHMEQAEILAAQPGPFIPTRHLAVNLQDEEQCDSAVRMWEELTAAGGEGMVFKPLDFIPERKGRGGMPQPAVKCRGSEYLRIIYGPEYNLPETVEKLKNRRIDGKQSLALREFALGIEGLERFAKGEEFHRIHECAFAVVALESEPIDPRL